jgi:putative ABC transport system permease protein
MWTLAFEIKDAARLLLRNRAYTVGVLLLLAMGIGISTSVFSIVNAVLLQPFPFRNVNRLALVWATPWIGVGTGVTDRRFEAWRQRNHVFSNLARFQINPVMLAFGADQSDSVEGEMVGVKTFSVLGVQPEQGRDFAPRDEIPGAAPVVIISHSLWHRLRARGDRVLGEAIDLNGKPTTVIGVMPGNFFFPDERVQVWLPLPQEDLSSGLPVVLARLRPHVTFQRAQTELDRLDKPFRDRELGSGRNIAPGVFSLYRVVVGPYRAALWTLFAAALALLLIACSNVSNLLMARGVGREHELAIRASLGAGRAAIVRLVFAESILLGLVGGLLGTACGWGCVRVFLLLRLASAPRINAASINFHVLAFAFLLSLLTGVVCGIFPAKRALRPSLMSGLQLGRQGTQARKQTSERSRFVAVEIGLALALLSASGLLAKSFLKLTHFDWGFDPDHVAVLACNLPSLQTGGQPPDLADHIRRSLALIPGVTEVATGSGVPLFYGYKGTVLSVDGRKVDWSAYTTKVSPGYFRTLRIPVLRGRTFSQQTSRSEHHLIVVDAAFATRLWPGQNPIGKQIQILKLREDLRARSAKTPRHVLPVSVMEDPMSWIPDGPPSQVIGEVANVRMYSLRDQPSPNIYVEEPSQGSFPMFERVALRTSVPAAKVLAPARQAILRIDNDLVVSVTTTMKAQVSAELGHGGSDELLLLISALFGGSALLLALTGVYGVVSFTVAQRTREIGVRRALGGQSPAIFLYIIRRELRPVILGAVFGLMLSFGEAGLLRKFLFRVSPLDPVALGAAACFMFLGALLACVLPAIRAIRIHPVDALRSE